MWACVHRVWRAVSGRMRSWSAGLGFVQISRHVGPKVQKVRACELASSITPSVGQASANMPVNVQPCVDTKTPCPSMRPWLKTPSYSAPFAHEYFPSPCCLSSRHMPSYRSPRACDRYTPCPRACGRRATRPSMCPLGRRAAASRCRPRTGPPPKTRRRAPTSRCRDHRTRRRATRRRTHLRRWFARGRGHVCRSCARSPGRSRRPSPWWRARGRRARKTRALHPSLRP